VFARLVFPIPLEHSFTYLVPEGLERKARPGCRARAPLGRKKLTGVIIAVYAEPPETDLELKELEEVLDERPVLSQANIDLALRLAREFLASPGELLQQAMPPGAGPAARRVVRLSGRGRAALESGALTPLEKKAALVIAGARRGCSPRHIQRRLKRSGANALIARMQAKGLVTVEEKAGLPVRAPAAGPGAGPLQLRIDFSPGPADGGLAGVEQAIRRREFRPCLCFGPRESLLQTYLSLLRTVVAGGGRALVLFPEIGPAEEFRGRVRTGLGQRPVLFHGRLNAEQRLRAWADLAADRAAVVIGTRSAVLLPGPGPDLIIVDSEHDDAYFQEENPVYDARRAALLRAEAEGVPVVFGSPRPTVEAFYEAGRSGRLVELGRRPPSWKITTAEHSLETGRIIGEALRARVQERLNEGEQVVLFLNRRGFASSVACRDCGSIPRCPRCGIPLVLHKAGGSERLVCHYCSRSEPFGSPCGECGGVLAARRLPGVQALEEELGRLFPKTSALRFDADTAADPARRGRMMRRFLSGRVRLLLGTRMLAAHGPKALAGLVGIINPETSLEAADFRAAKEAYDMVSEMAGLCRDDPSAEIVVQTSPPVHYSIETALAGDYRAFFERELGYRKLMGYPPFAELAEMVLTGRDLRALGARSRRLADELQRAGPGVEVLGPALVYRSKLKGQAAVQVLARSSNREALEQAMRDVWPGVGPRKKLRFAYRLF
jgi:primosomal protein N' (replication factor Y)